MTGNHTGQRTDGPIWLRLVTNVVRDENGCWLWQRATNEKGYGRVQFQGRHRAAHRVSYTTFVGPIPEGLQLDHLCRVRHCINPAHLEPVTHDENHRRKTVHFRTTVTHCPHGHEYTEANTAYYNRIRCCRKCLAAQALRRYYRKTGRPMPERVSA
jgi:hypothetical protein